jgi:hypothetical protein
VVGRRSAAAADEVHEPVAGEPGEVAARVGGLLVVCAELVRQASVRVARDVRRRHAREILHERPHLLRTEGAVDADDQRLRVLDGRPKRLDRLSREIPAAHVDSREREPERELRRRLLRGDDRRLRVQRVEDRLDEQDVDPAFRERRYLFRVRLAHHVERDGAVSGIVDLRREGQRHVERPDRARDEAAVLVRDGAGEPRALERHLRRVILEPVVGLADARRGERVRRGDVGAGLEVAPVDVRDDLRPRQVEHVGVAGDVVRMFPEALAAVRILPTDVALDEHAPRAVEDGDPLPEKTF